ncbi:MAG: hypothetical protein H6706_16275 [Myxococcales bacterium]|nr:hypothetical protein [Myxococcales bacterium]
MSEKGRPTGEGEERRSRGEPDERRGRGLLDAIMPDLVKKVLAQGVEALGEEKVKETLVAELFRKALNKGGEVVDNTEDSLRRIISELPLPKELIERITARLDDYKADILGLVKDEIREFLDRIDLGYELQKMLTTLSLEVSTEIRFVPNERGIKPDVQTRARVKKTRRGRPEEGAE